MGHARAATFVGSAGRWVPASWACCGPGAASLGGEWRCVAGMYHLHGGGAAMGSGEGWVRGRLPVGSGCRGLTVGGSSAVSPWCVPWWPLVGWLRGVLGVSCIHGGTTVCWPAVVGCGGGACVGVVRVAGGRVSCVVVRRLMVAHCGGAWGVVLGLTVPGRARDMRVGDGWGAGGARVCGFMCSPSAPSAVSSSAFPLSLSLCMFVFFLGGGACGWTFAVLGVGVGACRCRCWCGCGCRGGWVAVALWVSRVCVGPQAPGGFRFSGRRSGGRRRRVVAWCLPGWSRLLGSAWVAWPDVGVPLGPFMAWVLHAVDGTASVGVAGLCGWDGAGCRVCVRRRAWWVGLWHCGRCNGWWRCW